MPPRPTVCSIRSLKRFGSMRSAAALLLTLTLLLTTGCGGGGGDDDADGGMGGGALSQFRVTATAAEDGMATAAIGIPLGVTKFSITASSSAPFARIDHVINPSNETNLNISGEFISLATEFQNLLSTATVPSRNFDPAVEAGAYDVIATAARSAGTTSFTPAAGVEVEFVVTTRSDDDLSSGRLTLNVFRVGELAQDGEARAAIDEGLQVMREIYADQAGIRLEINLADLAGPTRIPFPFEGGELYLQAAAGAPSPAVNLFIGAEIDFEIGTGTLLGVSASIPGPAHPTLKSAVAVSILGNAGPDGVFSDNEKRVFGESFAHEVGHYLGLFHPIELDGLIGFIAMGEDSLPDTPTCFTLFDCLENESLVRNLMFPTPLPSEDGETFPQNLLTAQQRGVLNRSVIVD